MLGSNCKMVVNIQKTTQIYQQIDHSKLVPLINCCVTRKLVTKIETLETKVAALEAA